MKKHLLIGMVGLVLLLISCRPAQGQILSDSFDSGLGNWTQSGTWGFDTAKAFSLLHSIFPRPPGRPSAFFARYAIEPVYDTAAVEASVNGGGSWIVLADYGGNPSKRRRT